MLVSMSRMENDLGVKMNRKKAGRFRLPVQISGSELLRNPVV
jgi:hypothetical protein